MTKKPEFDIVLWGESGFAGKLVAEYWQSSLGDRRAKHTGMANHARILRHRCSKTPHYGLRRSGSPIFSSIVARTKVVLSTVGPYALHGKELIEACACVFQSKVATDSRRKLPPIPLEGCHLFQSKAATLNSGN